MIPRQGRPGEQASPLEILLARKGAANHCILTRTELTEAQRQALTDLIVATSSVHERVGLLPIPARPVLDDRLRLNVLLEKAAIGVVGKTFAGNLEPLLRAAIMVLTGSGRPATSLSTR